MWLDNKRVRKVTIDCAEHRFVQDAFATEAWFESGLYRVTSGASDTITIVKYRWYLRLWNRIRRIGG